MAQEEERRLNALVLERFLGRPLQFSGNANVAISWNEIPETENIQSTPSVTQPMSEEAVAQARQLFSSPMFTTQPTRSVQQTRPTPLNAALATPPPDLVPSSSKTCRPTQGLQSSIPCSNPPVFQTRNSTFSLISKYYTFHIYIMQCKRHIFTTK